MKTYVLTFTEDADNYDLNLQHKAIRESKDNCYFKNIKEEISFEKIDEAVEEARNYGYDNFVCLCEDEDIDILTEGLNSEYGQLFDNIDVIPEQFYRRPRMKESAGYSYPAPLGTEITVDGANWTVITMNAQNINQATAVSCKSPENENIVKTAKKDQSGNWTITEDLQKDTKSTEVAVYFISSNYPTDKNLRSLSAQAQTYFSSNTPVAYVLCGAVQGQQFLRSESLKPLSEEIPNNPITDNIKGMHIFNNSYHCANPVSTEGVVAALRIIANRYQAATKFKVYTPYNVTITNNQIKRVAANGGVNQESIVNTEIVKLNPCYNASENQKIFENIKALMEGEKNDFKNMPSAVRDKVKEKEQEEAKKAAQDPEGFKKQYETSQKIWEQEMQSGWPEYVKKLMAATKAYLSNPNEQQRTQEQMNQAIKDLINTILAPAKNDLKPWTDALNAVGVGFFVGYAVKIAKSAKKMFKIKADSPEVRKFKNMVTTNAYMQIKEAFGYTSNQKDMQAMIDAERDYAVGRNITTAQEKADEGLKKEGLTK